MANIRYTSELMTNFFSASSVQASHIASVWDPETRQPIAFTLSHDEIPILQMIRTNAEGQRVTVSLKSLLSDLPANSHVQAFDVQQSTDLKVHLAFATKKDDRHSNLWVVAPFELFHDLRLKLMSPATVGTVHSIRLGLTDVPDQTYPALWLFSQPINRTAAGSDVTRAEVSLESNLVTIWKDISLPMNVQKILDVAPSSCEGYGRGLYFLYEHHGKVGVHVKFMRPGEEPGDGAEWSQFDMPCPPTASSIASFVDFTNLSKDSSLVLASDEGLYLYTSQNTTQNMDPTILSEASCLIGAKHLRIAQDDRHISVWGRNSKDELGYLSGTIEALWKARTATILPPGRAASFTTLISRPREFTPASHALLAADSSGDFTFLQQALDTGIWRNEPFYTEQRGDLKPIQSYTVNATIRDKSGALIRSGKIKFKTSSFQTVTINGRLTTLDTTGVWCRLSPEGETTVIMPTNGVTSQPLEALEVETLTGEKLEILEVKMLTGKTVQTTGNKHIDPSKHVVQGLESLSTSQGLASATTKNSSKSLWEGQEKPSDADLADAAKCFGAITQGYRMLPGNGSIIKPVVGAASKIRDDVKDYFMDEFHWIKEQIHEVTHWIVEEAGEVWEFSCRIGNRLKTFVLDCVEKITEAASWVWQKLKLGWEKLCDFVGFVFDWQDILHTKKAIKDMINSGSDFLAFKVESAKDKIDSFFGDIDDKVDTIKGLLGSQTAKELISQDVQEDDQMKGYMESPAAKWVGERMRNANSEMTAKGTVSQDPAEIDIMKDRVTPLVESIVDLVKTLAEDIQLLFHEQGRLTVNQMLVKLGPDFMSKALNVIKNTLKVVITAAAKLILWIKDVANAELTSGFINDLWRWLNRQSDLNTNPGTNFSILDAVCLIIAIPSTYIIKLATLGRPPKLGTIDRTIFNEKLAKDTSVIVMGSNCGTAVIRYELNKLKLLYRFVSGGVSASVTSYSPGTIVEIMTNVMDAFSIYKDLTEPEHPAGWEAEMAFTCTIVKLCSLAVGVLHMGFGKIGLQNNAVDEAKEIFDVISALVVFGLDAGVYVGDMEKGEDKGSASVSAANSLLETVSSVGYFTANEFKDKQPITAGIGLAVCQAAALEGIVSKGVEFRLKYQKL